jgi:hypothetical protein
MNRNSLPPSIHHSHHNESLRVLQSRKSLKKKSSPCVAAPLGSAGDSVLRTEMEHLESEEEDAPRRVLWFKPMSWLGQIRPHRRDEGWSASLRQTFFASVSVLIYQPYRSYRSRLAVAGSLRSIRLGTTSALVHSGAKKAHDWVVDQIADLFRTTHKVKTQQVARGRGQRCGDIDLAGYLANRGGSGAFGAGPTHRT